MTGRKLGLRKRMGCAFFRSYAEKIAEHKLRTLFWECTLRCLNVASCAVTAVATVGVDPGVPDMPLADF